MLKNTHFYNEKEASFGGGAQLFIRVQVTPEQRRAQGRRCI